MPNTVSIVRTRFEDLGDGKKSYGWRISDGYDSAYHDGLADEDALPGEDLDFLGLVACAGDRHTDAILETVIRNESPITIDGSEYDWDEIEDVLGPLDLQD